MVGAKEPVDWRVAVTAIVALVVIVVSAELHSGDPLLPLKLVVIGVVAYIAGVKIQWLPRLGGVIHSRKRRKGKAASYEAD